MVKTLHGPRWHGVVPALSFILLVQVFHQMKLLKAHKNKHHGAIDAPFPCEKCNKTFNSENDLKLHCILHSKGPWKCTICYKEFNGLYKKT